MSEYILSCCSTADVTKEHLDAIGVSFICFHFRMDGVEYLDDLGQTMPFDDFYKRMDDGAEVSTAQVNISDYFDYFCGFLEQGKDVLHVSLSSGLSGSYNSAVNAAEMAKEKYPDRKIFVVDSLGASSGYGLLVTRMAELRDEGMSVEKLYHWAEDNKLKMHHWFFSTDLTHYIKGGRVSKTAGFFGGMLGICPLLNMDHMGRLIPRAKIRSKKKVIGEIVQRMEQCADSGLDYNGKCFISNSYCKEDAEAVAKLVKERFPKLDGDVQIFSIGTTIGSHTGPGTVALFFWGDKRKN